jgi:hypothetical protein
VPDSKQSSLYILSAYIRVIRGSVLPFFPGFLLNNLSCVSCASCGQHFLFCLIVFVQKFSVINHAAQGGAGCLSTLLRSRLNQTRSGTVYHLDFFLNNWKDEDEDGSYKSIRTSLSFGEPQPYGETNVALYCNH